jgi:hypothetical protein
MSDPRPLDEWSNQTETVVSLGKLYKEALFKLDPRLSNINQDDVAMGFEVGSGADVVAFAELGFNKAIVTNNQSASYSYAFQKRSEEENKILGEVLKFHSPSETNFSNLGLSDWLKIENFHPRLVTMLRMSPSCFNGEDPTEYIGEVIRFHEKLKSNGALILSALADHSQSETAFRFAEKELSKKNIDHQLFIGKDVPPNLQVLGERILVIKK